MWGHSVNNYTVMPPKKEVEEEAFVTYTLQHSKMLFIMYCEQAQSTELNSQGSDSGNLTLKGLEPSTF